jgi:hypothetical protein
MTCSPVTLRTSPVFSWVTPTPRSLGRGKILAAPGVSTVRSKNGRLCRLFATVREARYWAVSSGVTSAYLTSDAAFARTTFRCLPALSVSWAGSVGSPRSQAPIEANLAAALSKQPGVGDGWHRTGESALEDRRDLAACLSLDLADPLGGDAKLDRDLSVGKRALAEAGEQDTPRTAINRGQRGVDQPCRLLPEQRDFWRERVVVGDQVNQLGAVIFVFALHTAVEAGEAAAVGDVLLGGLAKLIPHPPAGVGRQRRPVVRLVAPDGFDKADPGGLFEIEPHYLITRSKADPGGLFEIESRFLITRSSFGPLAGRSRPPFAHLGLDHPLMEDAQAIERGLVAVVLPAPDQRLDFIALLCRPLVFRRRWAMSGKRRRRYEVLNFPSDAGGAIRRHQSVCAHHLRLRPAFWRSGSGAGRA